MIRAIQHSAVKEAAGTQRKGEFFIMSIVTDLLAGISEFLADVLVLRRQRDKAGRASRDLADDAVAVACFDFVTTLWLALVSVGLMFLLIFGFNIPVVWGVGIGMAVGAAWGYWRYRQLVREE